MFKEERWIFKYDLTICCIKRVNINISVMINVTRHAITHSLTMSATAVNMSTWTQMFEVSGACSERNKTYLWYNKADASKIKEFLKAVFAWNMSSMFGWQAERWNKSDMNNLKEKARINKIKNLILPVQQKNRVN